MLFLQRDIGMVSPLIRFRAQLLIAPLAAALVLGFAGCATGDSLRAAHLSMDRAAAVEPPAAYFAPILARAGGEAKPPPVAWRARQHYLAVISSLEGLTVRGEEALNRQGRLGDAFVLKALAQWRLGRVEDARASGLRARVSGQEALDAGDRALFRAFEGVARLEAALDALEADKPLAEIESLLAGDTGAWRVLAGARTELPGNAPLQRELIQARLAVFKVLREARSKAADVVSTEDDEWSRLRAEAQIELTELAALPAQNAKTLGALVRHWQTLCGLVPPRSAG